MGRHGQSALSLALGSSFARGYSSNVKRGRVVRAKASAVRGDKQALAAVAPTRASAEVGIAVAGGGGAAAAANDIELGDAKFLCGDERLYRAFKSAAVAGFLLLLSLGGG
mmetsp:Transcript_8026/g.15309  ORF Transcript_8026/g.15309 Transcript_8026/m.15309 type:complete len:110 (-) Transcript_8026:108-437(-)